MILAIVSIATIFVACEKDGTKNDPNSELLLRAKTLGFDDSDSYVTFVQTCCMQENHQNCNICVDGEHRVCDNPKHEGQHHNGTHHNGSGHGNCGENHRACCTGEGCHQNGNHHGRN